MGNLKGRRGFLASESISIVLGSSVEYDGVGVEAESEDANKGEGPEESRLGFHFGSWGVRGAGAA